MPSPKPSVKKTAPSGKVKNSVRQEFAILTRDVKASLFGWARQFEKFRDIVKNNYELGRMHLGLGNLRDAMLRFKFVLWLNPLHVDAMYYLGATYMAGGDKKAAAPWFAKVLKIRPNFEEAKYLLSVAGAKPVTGADMPTRMPLTLAVEYFDSIAAGYNAQQLEMLKYEGHIQLDNALRSCLTPGRIDHVILELGVGTGLCGPGVRDVASHLTGVDISAKMLEEAMKQVDSKGQKIYDALIRREAVDFLKEAPDSGYNILLSAGMFSYLGDLEAVFQHSKRVLKDGGFFAFTADTLNGEGYRFEPADARFSFSKSYLQDLAARCGFKELRFKDYAVYAEYPAWVCVYQKM